MNTPHTAGSMLRFQALFCRLVTPCWMALFVLEARLTGADSCWCPFASSAPAAASCRASADEAGLSSDGRALEDPSVSRRDDAWACLSLGSARERSAMFMRPAAPRPAAAIAMGGPMVGPTSLPLKLRVPSCGSAGKLSTLRRLTSSSFRRPASRSRCRFCSCRKGLRGGSGCSTAG